jgi:hypothetical protein
MWQGRPRPCSKAEAALPHHALSVSQLLHKNQSQNLSCFRQWEFRSLGDLESLNDSKTPKLQAAKAMIVELWNCEIMPLWHYEIEGGQFQNVSLPQCHNARTDDRGQRIRLQCASRDAAFILCPQFRIESLCFA